MKGSVCTSNLAYVVGLLATDGNLSNDKRHIIFRSSDIQLIKTFSDYLNLKNKIGSSPNWGGYAKKPSYRVQFGDVTFYKWLLKQGLFPAKTYTIGKISVPDRYFKDFLKGHLDGDGSIITYVDNYNSYKGRVYANTRLIVHFISASQAHINWLYEKINNLAGVKGALYSHRMRTGIDIWRIKFSKKESIKLLGWIYYKNELPCLQRKEQIARRVLTIIPQKTRKKYEKFA